MRIPATLPLLALAMAIAGPACAQPADTPRAEYHVRLASVAPLRLDVEATLPSAGDRLAMGTSRPGDVAELDAGGWPAIVHDLVATDREGHVVATAGVGAEGWKLEHAVTGPLKLRYRVDYAPLESRGWPAPRESAWADAGHVVLAGRSFAVVVPHQGESRIAIEPPKGWQVAAPWRKAHEGGRFLADTPDDLEDNLLVLTREAPAHAVAGRFDVAIVAIGPWRAVRDDARRLLAPVARWYLRALPVDGDQAYLMVLLPQREHGGESFRNSFAMNLEEVPSRANIERWGNTLAHELFHYWNGWRLRGADYAATQWFQEGFTEYMANKAMLATGAAGRDGFARLLARHAADARKLATPLDAPGTHKGPPLYGAGALVAFSWDVAIREASGGRRDLRDVFAALWKSTGHGAGTYDWDAIRAALAATAPGDWDGFHARAIAGREPVPFDAALHVLGLRLVEPADASATLRVEPDPDASSAAREAWSRFAAY